MLITHKELGHKAGLFQFKKIFNIDDLPQRGEIKLFADTKYRLYVNDNFIQVGPSKRSEFYSYFDTVDILKYLKKGENEISVYVLHLDPSPIKEGRQHVETMIAGSHLGLAAEITVGDEIYITDSSWLVSPCPELDILPPVRIPYGASMAGIFQKIDYNLLSREFTPAYEFSPLKSEGSDASFTEVYNFCGESMLYRLKPSPIPPLTYKEGAFVNCNEFSGKDTTFVLNAGEHSTAAVQFKVSGKKGTKITLTYAEAYWKKNGDDKPYKEVRDDESGFIFGSSDEIILDGTTHIFETFFWQCFRFIEVKIEGEAFLTDIKLFRMRYPLNNEASFVSSDKDSEKMWEISVRTLNNCMHDSFEDCPYYEQLQYAMDSRLQAIFLRQLTDDKRLIIKCIDDFNEGRFPDGMIPCRTPSLRKQRIPGFGLHYIYMLHDHMLYERNSDRIKDLLPVADGILRYFERNINDSGVVGPLGVWSYVDWVSTWHGGIPTLTGSIAVYNFMLIVAYENAYEMALFSGRRGLAEEYKEKAEKLRISTKSYFYDENKKLFKDSEESVFSMHSQIWAVLADVVTGNEARDLLQRTYDDKELPICSYSMMFFVFRAYEKVGLYHLAYKMLDNWREMIDLHATTWFESSPLKSRSDCHAWSSLPIYEFSACILGVKVTMDGIIIKPYVDANDFASGTVMTPIGKISVDWKKENGTLMLKVNAPEKVKIILPDNSEHFEKDIELKCKI